MTRLWLSAVVFSQHEEHSLDALTHRLGITISEEARHTALGDAVTTALAWHRERPPALLGLLLTELAGQSSAPSHHHP